MSTDPDFFRPLHVEHLGDWCPQVLPFLGLPPGWRFLLGDGYEDVWEDKSLLDVREGRDHSVATYEPLLIGLYGEAGDLAIEGGPTALQLFASAIREARGHLELSHPADRSAEPYDGFLESIVVNSGTGKVIITKRGTTLLIEGASESRACLADDIDALSVKTWQGDHIHVDYHPDHFYLSPGTAALIVELRK